MAKLLEECDDYMALNGIELTLRREALGLNQTEFAEQCGWSQPYQCKLEQHGIHRIPKETANEIMKILRKLR